jgi:hypothetical protein
MVGVRYARVVFVANAFRVQRLSDGIAVFFRWLAPVALDRCPCVAQPLLVGIPVLRDNRRDPLRMRHRQPKSRGRAVVEDIERIAGELERIREGEDGPGQRVKRVCVTAFGRNLRESEAGQVGSNHAVTVGEPRNQLAVLKRRCGKAVKQKHHRRILRAGFAVKDVDAIRIDAMDGCERHTRTSGHGDFLTLIFVQRGKVCGNDAADARTARDCERLRVSWTYSKYAFTG